MILTRGYWICGQFSYLGRGLEAGHSLGQDLLLASGERVEATTGNSSLGGRRSGTVLGVIRFVCHVEKMQNGSRMVYQEKLLVA